MIYVSLTKNEEEKNIVLVVWMFMVSPKENSKLAHSRTEVQRERVFIRLTLQLVVINYY